MIYLPPPQPALNKDIRISGDVKVHPTASLAPGVILQAAPNYRIVIGADVCIGMGVIINACNGSIEIDSGAILGSGVLIVGAGKIGNNACIGTSSTIFQADIPAMAVIEPGSIVGDPSRSVDLGQEKQQSKQPQSGRQTQAHRTQSVSGENASKASNFNQQYSSPSSEQVKEVKTSVEPHIQSSKPPVVGQVYINELLITLFPHKKELNSGS